MTESPNTPSTECTATGCSEVGLYPSKRGGLCDDHWAANVAAHMADTEGLDKELAIAEFEYFEDLTPTERAALLAEKPEATS